MTIVSVKSVALTADRDVAVGPNNPDITVIFAERLRKAAIDISRDLARQYRRIDLDVKVYG